MKPTIKGAIKRNKFKKGLGKNKAASSKNAIKAKLASKKSFIDSTRVEGSEMSETAQKKNEEARAESVRKFLEKKKFTEDPKQEEQPLTPGEENERLNKDEQKGVTEEVGKQDPEMDDPYSSDLEYALQKKKDEEDQESIDMGY